MNSEVKQEMQYAMRVLCAFENYRQNSLQVLKLKENSLSTIQPHGQNWLPDYRGYLEKVKECLEKNSEFFPHVVQYAYVIFSNFYSNVGLVDNSDPFGRVRLHLVLQQLMREWSALGAAERKQCYEPIVEEIVSNYSHDLKSRSNINILVPGAGLGRLVFDIAAKGFCVQGNEFNFFMLFVSYYVLNVCDAVEEFEVFPWVYNYGSRDEMTSVKFPDVRPQLPSNKKLSMVAGDFLEVYTNSDEWHCVATCFFIDCAENIVQLIERIYKILKPGGLWINLGPLTYQYSDFDRKEIVEPDFEILVEVIERIGFTVEKYKTGLKTKYCQNPNAMVQKSYDSVFFVCKKPYPIDD